MKNLIKFGAIAFFSSAMTLQSAEFESNIAMSSDYVWRGMTQTAEEPAPAPKPKAKAALKKAAKKVD